MNRAPKTHTKFSISLDTELLKKLESKRGLIPRSAYIEKLLEDAIDADEEK